ncbi:hypothetical protein VP01_513g6 [Puccinia sorghi]|uniref:Uncharacterized protein n=1 Tax=Puccinia sorghi TaxID=27349 RepID=A0A0L6UL29_9BASI|nr:hypothetical protein VP01_513g6 [Puccinia sorghi]
MCATFTLLSHLSRNSICSSFSSIFALLLLRFFPCDWNQDNNNQLIYSYLLLLHHVETSHYCKTSRHWYPQVSYSMIFQNLATNNLCFFSTTFPPEYEFNGCALWVLLQKKYAGSNLISRSTALNTFLDLEYDSISSFAKSIFLDCVDHVGRLRDPLHWGWWLGHWS